jgi:small subunit ribosomal protein S17
MSEKVGTRGHKKVREGIVLASKMDKTIVVKVMRKTQHPRFKKYINVTKKYYAHDEANTAQVGDKVKIIESKPLSKLKRWRLLEVVS